MSALVQKQSSLDVRQAIVRHLIDHVDNPSVSIFEVTIAVRKMFPLCELTDWQIGDLIARSAIDAGFVIDFDAAA
ncbi:MAG: hypothetical protein E5X53_26730 [Mesorhizobium sp.]|jgi:hypothetical protein|uniref:hypothetical protein n=1 Tax=Mesorhizobium sp. TaxID=1871066 RepID=UPI000FE99568|nr:hypothetical protein [Mesorhizobium sp.]RWM21774.1 MAG: hypothetical protein EOR73_10230 [Mesorhizobium sp.]TIP71118.1 MAG: hypothetical protein E5X55_24140 [Mesorhizobium sp.]TIQ08812.1 MAG: hypothetical protein E5X57_21480 [Mesorhizobium sp.]TIR48954.1 MAG: hypothetical protein E5X53_26730 [Mesorhizobium sp.]TJV95600.1 MAG: hypothetical protein E5X52_23255 [Mesorhizobium sp.]